MSLWLLSDGLFLFLLMLIDRDALIWSLGDCITLLSLEQSCHGREEILKLWTIERVEKLLMLHQLNLQVLVRLIVVSQQVVDAFEQGGESAAVVFFFE